MENDRNDSATFVIKNMAATIVSLPHLQLFRGVFDLHVTVAESQLYLVTQFAHQRGINLAFAVGKSGKHCQQLMTSNHLNAANGEEVLMAARELVGAMEQQGITILRVKIEALAGTASTQEAMKQFMNTPEYQENCKYAYEFHYKVQIDTPEEQQLLEQLCALHGVSYALNILSKKEVKYPLISQRVRGDYEKALRQRESFRQVLAGAGLTCLLDGTHFEAIIYDSNYALDEGFVPDPIEVS